MFKLTKMIRLKNYEKQLIRARPAHQVNLQRYVCFERELDLMDRRTLRYYQVKPSALLIVYKY